MGATEVQPFWTNSRPSSPKDFFWGSYNLCVHQAYVAKQRWWPYRVAHTRGQRSGLSYPAKVRGWWSDLASHTQVRGQQSSLASDAISRRQRGGLASYRRGLMSNPPRPLTLKRTSLSPTLPHRWYCSTTLSSWWCCSTSLFTWGCHFACPVGWGCCSAHCFTEDITSPLSSTCSSLPTLALQLNWPAALDPLETKVGTSGATP